MSSYTKTIQRIMDGDYDNATPEDRASAVRDLIQMCAIAAGAVSFQPFPLLDIALVSPIQIGMVQAIGRIHGHKLDQKAVLEILSTFGASILAQNVIMAAAKFVPFFGWLVTMSMAYALTYAIGEVSDHYFRNGRGVAPDDLRTMFEKVYAEKKAERESSLKNNEGSLKQRLEQLNEARAAGLISEEEFQKKKEDILAAL